MNDQCLDIKMDLCFWCGEPKGIGIGKKTISCYKKWDNNNMISSYEPCDKCKEQWDKGFIIIEVSEEPNAENQPEIQKGFYPTGRMWVIKNEAAERIFGKEKTKYGKVFVDSEIAKKIGLYNGEETESK